MIKRLSHIGLWIFLMTIIVAGNTPVVLYAQPTPISGTINLYRKVTLVDCPGNQVTVSPNAAGYGVGDKVLLIQTEGATVEENNVITFGSITNIGYTGNYEIHTIAAVAGNVITFQYQILRDYDPLNGAVQLVRIAHHQDAEITSAGITCQGYDPVSQTGGVLALFVDDTLYFGGNVNVQYLGFPQGEDNYDNTNCNFSNTTDYGNYYYPWTSSTSNFNGAPKGYGIRARIPNKEGGRGKLANGGGGGNQHNAGGAGGSNYGAGGRGGIRAFPRSSFFGPYCKGYMYAYGGQPLSVYYSNFENRIYMGGGGGAGHTANSSFDGLDGEGGAGGPIVIIRANVVVRSGTGARYINAFGRNGPTNGGDGSGGGGAGGTVLLDINTYGGTNVFHVRAYGGRGGAQNWGAAREDCMGAGGGGGGGVIWYSGGTIPTVGLATRLVNGGLEGNMSGGGCTLVPNDTTYRKHQPGGNGVEMTGLIMPESNSAPNGCVLPVEYAAFQGEQVYDKVRLEWVTATEKSNREFIIQRAPSPEEAFIEIGSVSGSGFSQDNTPYTFDDQDPLSGTSWYRLKQVDFNGGYTFSQAIQIEFKPEEKLIHKVYPNPVDQGKSLVVEFYFEESESANIIITDQLGRMVYQGAGQYNAGRNELSIPTGDFHPGMYLLQIINPVFRDVKRFMVQ